VAFLRPKHEIMVFLSLRNAGVLQWKGCDLSQNVQRDRNIQIKIAVIGSETWPLRGSTVQLAV